MNFSKERKCVYISKLLVSLSTTSSTPTDRPPPITMRHQEQPAGVCHDLWSTSCHGFTRQLFVKAAPFSCVKGADVGANSSPTAASPNLLSKAATTCIFGETAHLHLAVEIPPCISPGNVYLSGSDDSVRSRGGRDPTPCRLRSCIGYQAEHNCVEQASGKSSKGTH